MQFLVTAYDGTDAGAVERRKQSEKAHRELGYDMIGSRQILFSTAILDDDGKTVGSLRVMNFESRAALDEWLAYEPYVVHEVWNDIDVRPCRMGPAFEWITLEPGEIRMTTSDDAS